MQRFICLLCCVTNGATYSASHGSVQRWLCLNQALTTRIKIKHAFEIRTPDLASKTKSREQNRNAFGAPIVSRTYLWTNGRTNKIVWIASTDILMLKSEIRMQTKLLNEARFSQLRVVNTCFTRVYNWTGKATTPVEYFGETGPEFELFFGLHSVIFKLHIELIIWSYESNNKHSPYLRYVPAHLVSLSLGTESGADDIIHEIEQDIW